MALLEGDAGAVMAEALAGAGDIEGTRGVWRTLDDAEFPFEYDEVLLDATERMCIFLFMMQLFAGGRKGRPH